MASSTATVTVTVGGKDSSLTSAAVFTIAAGLATATIDSSALDKLSQSKKPPLPYLPNLPTPLPPKTLASDEESRAALLVLLSKLLSAGPGIRAAVPLLIQQTLTLTSGHKSLDFASPPALLASLRTLTGTTGPIDLTREELAVLDRSAAASIGMCALLDHSSAALSRVSDAVAALSCEAARTEISTSFDYPVSSSTKHDVDTARDMKELLLGSKLVGQVSSGPFAGIPNVHGRFRRAVKFLHEGTREMLKSAVKTEKTDGAGESVKVEDLVDVVSPIALCIRLMGENSFDRARSVAESIADEGLRLKVVEEFEKHCSGFGAMKKQLAEFYSIIGEGTYQSDYGPAINFVLDALVNLRQILAWEAALSLFALEVDDSVEKAQPSPQTSIDADGGNKKGEKKSKKSKKKTLGKGTSVIRQLLIEKLADGNETAIKDAATMVMWADKLMRYFDSKETGLDVLLGKVKEILESNEARRLPKIPKGTRDFGKEQMAIRERVFSIITRVFKMHGATALDTPVFELKETLMGKYGEDSKLIYDLADQGGELCSLRYDLTVPFARYLAMHNLSSLKRYQIAKVYRRDNPSKGRFREFYQCDFDIAGQYETMGPDFEVIKVLTQILDQLDIGDYEVKLNHRKLLDGMLEICGVSSDKFRTVCSSIDKLDKQSFEQIRKELVFEKGINDSVVDRIGELVKKRGPPLEILSELKKEGSAFLENNGSVVALNELEIFFKALENSKCLNRVVFDLSLARGLDYYTGVVFEAVFKGTTQVGSIAAGGRYDNLVGMFSGKQVPAVGVSLGIERVFAIMEQQQLGEDGNQKIRPTETQVLVAILGKEAPFDVTLAAEVTGELWNAGINAEFQQNKNVRTHIKFAEQSGIPWMVILGESELNAGMVTLKDIEARKEEEIPRDRLVEQLKSRLNII